MSSIADVQPPYRVQCLRSEKKLTSQLYTASGMSSKAIFWSNVAWRTVSNALLKSRARTTTYGLLYNSSLIECNNSYYCGSSGSSGSECVLVSEVEWNWRYNDGWIKKIPDNDSLQRSAKDRRDWNWPVVRALLRCGNLWDWLDISMLPLTGYCWRCYGLIE